MRVLLRTGRSQPEFGSVRQSETKLVSAVKNRSNRKKGQGQMKKVVVSVVAAIAVAGFAIPAIAGDLDVKKKKVVVAPPPPPNPWDVAFGGALMTDYVFRGITQSGHNPSVAGYIEPRYNLSPEWQLYAGISGESIKFPNNAAAEI